MNIIKYLNKQSIDWFYINLQIKDNKKKLCRHTLEDQMPKMTDFIDKRLVKLRQQQKYKTDYIAIDTSNVFQIDVDSIDAEGEPYTPDDFKELCETNPFFLSSTKKLPHIFVKDDKKATKKRSQLGNNVELLSGQWSFCETLATVYNPDNVIGAIDLSKYGVDEIKADKKKTTEKNTPATSKGSNTSLSSEDKCSDKFNIDEVKQLFEKCISKKRADDYTNWIEIGMCLFNMDSDMDSECFRIWDDFSSQSLKYVHGECQEKWSSFSKKPGGLTVSTLYHYAKLDNLNEWNLILSNRISDDIKEFDNSHYAVAQVMYQLFKHEFVCATPDGKLWYFYNGHLWEEDVEHLHLRRYISNQLIKQYDKAFHQIHVEAPIGDMDSDASSNSALNIKKKMLDKLREKLKDYPYKCKLISESSAFFYDKTFLSKIDANPNHLGFNNGVYHLKEKVFVPSNPQDYVSLSVGYDYRYEKNNEKYEIARTHFRMLHPNEEQNNYYVKTLARQLYGDSGHELFHIHSGSNGSAANGKTKSWEINNLCLGDYIKKFGVGMLVTNIRKDVNSPNPEYRLWKGRRILYCSEPNPGETINSGIMKDYTGGEMLLYRLLFSNCFDQYVPQFKLHIMTNDLPQIDGTDEGVKRRARVLPYISTFTTDENRVNEDINVFLADTEVTFKYREDDEQKMEFIRYLLDNYVHDWKYDMTTVIQESSRKYLSDNDDVARFVQDCLIRRSDGHITLKRIKELLNNGDYKNSKPSTLKSRLERVMGVECINQKRIAGERFKNVFLGYAELCDDIEISENDEHDEL